MWCAYEVATWIHLGRDFRRTAQLLPVTLALGLLTTALGVYSSAFVVLLVIQPCCTGALFVVLQIAVIISSICFTIYHLRLFVWDLSLLRRQLKEFKVEESRCHCCDSGHPEGMPCDRELVYAALKEWFETEESGDSEIHLEKFNQYVQNEVEPAVTNVFWSPWGRYKMCLFMSLGIFWTNCARMHGAVVLAREAGSIVALRWGLLLAHEAFVGVPSGIMCTLWCATLTKTLGGNRVRVDCRSLVLTLVVVVVVLLLTNLVLSMPIRLTQGLESPIFQCCALAWSVLCSILIFAWPLRP